ncbi:hypothetical protein MSC49_12730 [Methylosinus sp. C49]|uniref:hypothetical protein n=1 Tax=Methylosinus sp. C49 TaxID=2699395 RepID=UPI001366BCD2|nr:hypothetical protein [Methylosinus sp. C49]BBU61338.1 hypothetical protein MSC49_12730 [Methylosinus sp. C49]
MLARQTVVYFAANVFSAIFGLLDTIVFTRVFAVAAYGDYLLGFGLRHASRHSALQRAEARHIARAGEGRRRRYSLRDRRRNGAARGGRLLFFVARMTGLAAPVSAAAVMLAFAVTLYETSQESPRAAQKAVDYLRGTVYRALLVSALGVAVAFASASGAALQVSSSIVLVAATALSRAAFAMPPPFGRLALVGAATAAMAATVHALRRRSRRIRRRSRSSYWWAPASASMRPSALAFDLAETRALVGARACQSPIA